MLRKRHKDTRLSSDASRSNYQDRAAVAHCALKQHCYNIATENHIFPLTLRTDRNARAIKETNEAAVATALVSTPLT